MLSTLRQFIMEYGSLLGISWASVFSLYILGLRQQNPLFLLLAVLGLIAVLPLALYLGARLKKRTVQLGLQLSPLFSLLNIFSMFMYACILCGAIEFAYFQFLDQGTLVQSLLTLLTQADTRQLYTQMGMTATYDQALELLRQLDTLSAFDKAMLLFSQNFWTSVLLAIPVTLVNRFYTPKIG